MKLAKRPFVLTRTVVATAVIWLWLLLVFSPLMLCQTSSDDGRLAIAFDPAALAFNQTRLLIPPGHAWAEIDLDYTIEADEALNFVIDRDEDQFDVIRLSRTPAQATALLTFVDGLVVEKKPLTGLPTSDLAAGTIRFRRTEGKISVLLNDRPLVEIAGVRPPGPFMFNLFPTQSTAQFDRVRVREVRLTDGSTLPPSYVDYVVRHPVFLLAMALAAAFLLVRFSRSILSKRGLCVQSIFLLVFSLAMVLLGVGTKLPFPAQTLVPHERVFARLVVTALFLIAIVVLAGGKRVARRWRWSDSHSTLWPSVTAGICGFLLVVAFALVIMKSLFYIWASQPLGVGRPDACPRVICFGGSTTYGWPFELGQPFEWRRPRHAPEGYPTVLQNCLRRKTDGPVAVYNVGLPNADIDTLLTRIPNDLAVARPTHIILNSIVNNARMDPAHLERSYGAALDHFAPWRENTFVVLEPELTDTLDPPCERPEREIVRAVARRKGFAVVEPREAFYAHRDEFLFMDDCHLTRYGHRLLARILESKISITDCDRPEEGVRIGGELQEGGRVDEIGGLGDVDYSISAATRKPDGTSSSANS